jgi:hypothetical protein
MFLGAFTKEFRNATVTFILVVRRFVSLFAWNKLASIGWSFVKLRIEDLKYTVATV